MHQNYIYILKIMVLGLISVLYLFILLYMCESHIICIYTVLKHALVKHKKI